MKLSTLEAVAQALDEAEVRFILVGGIAVVAHGYGRLTRDVDLVIELREDVLGRAFEALESLGYRPRVPVTAAGLADARQRTEWIEGKGMTVLNFHSDLHIDTPIDLFVTEPFDFDAEYRQALVVEIEPGRPVHVVRLATLLRMKDEAGRPQDLADAAELRHLHSKDDA
jgi:hypothetical protein